MSSVVRCLVSRLGRLTGRSIGDAKLRSFCSASTFRSAAAQHDDGVLRSRRPDLTLPTGKTLTAFVMEKWNKYGSTVGMVDGSSGKTYTYEQLTEYVRKASSGLRRQGFKRGDVATIVSPNSPEFAIAYLAIIASGGTASTLNPLYTSRELVHALNHSGSTFLFADSALKPVVSEALKACPSVRSTVSFGVTPGSLPFESLLADDGSLFTENLDIDVVNDVCALPYSSGTTGLPKAVMLTHQAVANSITQLSGEEGVDYRAGEDVLLAVLPFFHIYGQVPLMLSSLHAGSRVVTVPSFRPQQFLELLAREKVTQLHLVPPMIQFLANHPSVDEFHLPSLRRVYCGAAPVGPETATKMLRRLNDSAYFLQGFGMTEVVISHLNAESDFRFDTCGPALPNVLTKVVDVESGRTLGPDEDGEVWLKTPSAMKGYLKDERATAEAIDGDGWIHSGDIGHWSAESSHLKITARLKELIKTKGFQVAPAELEALLVTHPDVEDVAVIGVADERAGELPKAFVVRRKDSKLSAQQVKDFIKGKVAPFKELDGGVEFRDSIPKSAAGKILRKELRMNGSKK